LLILFLPPRRHCGRITAADFRAATGSPPLYDPRGVIAVVGRLDGWRQREGHPEAAFSLRPRW